MSMMTLEVVMVLVWDLVAEGDEVWEVWEEDLCVHPVEVAVVEWD